MVNIIKFQKQKKSCLNRFVCKVWPIPTPMMASFVWESFIITPILIISCFSWRIWYFVYSSSIFFLESTFALWIKNINGKGIYLTTYKSNQPEVCQSVSTLCLRTIIIYFVLLETSAIQNNSENGNIGREVLQYRHSTFLGKRCALATLYVKMQVKGTHDK